MGLFAKGFGLRPLVLDGIEIGRIRRQVSPGVAGLTECVLDVLPFVEGGVIEDDHGGGRQLRKEHAVGPSEEDLGVDAGFKKANGDELEIQKRTDHISALLGVPVPTSITALPDGGIAVSVGSVVGKPALVDPNQRSPSRLIRRATGLKGTPHGGVRARMRQRLFYRKPTACSLARNKSHFA